MFWNTVRSLCPNGVFFIEIQLKDALFGEYTQTSALDIQIERSMKSVNVLNRVFSATDKEKIWVGDITYVPTRHGFLYLAVFIDIFHERSWDGLWIQE